MIRRDYMTVAVSSDKSPSTAYSGQDYFFQEFHHAGTRRIFHLTAGISRIEDLPKPRFAARTQSPVTLLTLRP